MMNDCADTHLTGWWQSYLSSNLSAHIIKERIISVSSYNSNSCIIVMVWREVFIVSLNFSRVCHGVRVQYLYLHDNDACTRIKIWIQEEDKCYKCIYFCLLPAFTRCQNNCIVKWSICIHRILRESWSCGMFIVELLSA